MLACVCQPTGKALYKCGPQVERIKCNNVRKFKSQKSIKAESNNEEMIASPITLINLKRIEDKNKITKILVNPVCSDGITSSDDSKSPKIEKKWKDKKKRLKSQKRDVKIDDAEMIYEKKSSINCFKSKNIKKASTNESTPSKDNCKNENSCNAKVDIPNVDDVIKLECSVKTNVGNNSFKAGDQSSSTPSELSSCGPKTYQQLGEGVELTLGELRAMALRQQQQIDTQHQLLAAKEQRLRYLKQQEARQHQVALEGERLRRLRERVEAQELKLRKLRALRGHVDRNKQINITLTSDLESIRALFNEKEKELSLAVAKVEELTRQLEELRRGRGAAPAPPAAALELEKLRRELMYRNKLNEQQNGRLSAQRCALGARQEEMRSIDRRVSELQARLLRKRALNRQLAAVHRQQGQRINSHSNNTLSGYTSNNNNATNIQNKNDQHQVQQRGNVAAVEPYNHIPHAQSVNSKQNYQSLKQNIVQTNVPLKHNQNEIQTHLQQHDAHYMQQKSLYNGYIQQTNQENYLAQYNAKINENYNHVQQGIGSYQQHDQKMIEHINKYIDGSKQYSPNIATNGQMNKEVKINEQEFPPEFAASKSDPKYQTLPYNTKFTTKPKTSPEMRNDENKNQMIPPNVNHMTVHSTPLSVINKSLATPLNQEQNSHQNDQSNQEGKENCSKMGVDSKVSKLQSNKSISATSSSSNASSFAKPISSVAPTSNHNGSKTSAVYQTSSTKIQPVQPQTINVSAQKTNKTNLNVTQNPQIIRNTASGLSTTVSTNSPSSNSIVMSPPQNASTPLSTPDVSVAEKPKPALPPKPYVKTPPRQSVDSQNDSNQTDMNDVETQHQQLPVVREPSEMIIKPKPLNFRKAPLSEQPKLRNVANKNGVSVSLNRRIEMPPAFLFPEMDHLAKDPSENSLKEQNKSERKSNSRDELDKVASPNDNLVDDECRNLQVSQIVDQINAIEVNGKSDVIRRTKKGNLKQDGKPPLTRRVSFDPLALLLDASLEGELELVKMTATKVPNPSAANDEGITALHNAICAGHFEIVKFLVEFGCDVNAQDSDGWTPLHCAASCNNLNMVRFLLDNGACIFATTLSDHETAAEKCEEDEEGFDGCSEYLYSVQEKLGIMNGGAVYAVFSYTANRNDELSFNEGERLTVLRKGDDNEREWWWARSQNGSEGYVPRNLLGLYPRVTPKQVERAVD